MMDPIGNQSLYYNKNLIEPLEIRALKGTVKEPKVVVLISGGLDSTTSAYLMAAYGFHIYGLSIHYGQRSAPRELVKATTTANKLGFVEHHVVDLGTLAEVLHSPLTNPNIVIDGSQNLHPESFFVVPFRNAIFLSIAVGYAESIGADMVVIGNHQDDVGETGFFPDTTPEFMDAFRNLVRHGTAHSQTTEPMIYSPFQHYKKSEIIAKGIELGVPYEDTWTCYQGNNHPCQVCETCHHRRIAFEKAGIADPLV